MVGEIIVLEKKEKKNMTTSIEGIRSRG